MEDTSGQPSKKLLYPLTKMQWSAVIKGKDSFNGAVYTRLLRGKVPEVKDGDDAYSVASALAKAIKQFHPEMIHVHSIQFALGNPEESVK